MLIVGLNRAFLHGLKKMKLHLPEIRNDPDTTSFCRCSRDWEQDRDSYVYMQTLSDFIS